jgi:hypothetical protein
VLDTAALSFVSSFAGQLARDWRMEIPLKIHVSARVFAIDGSPEWSPEFSRWIERARHESGHRDRRGPYQNSPERKRSTTAMRKLRKAAPSEFRVCYDACVLNPIEPGTPVLRACIGIAARLNQRAAEHGYPERYSANDVIVLLYSGLDKIRKWQ